MLHSVLYNLINVILPINVTIIIAFMVLVL